MGRTRLGMEVWPEVFGPFKNRSPRGNGPERGIPRLHARKPCDPMDKTHNPTYKSLTRPKKKRPVCHERLENSQTWGRIQKIPARPSCGRSPDGTRHFPSNRQLKELSRTTKDRVGIFHGSRAKWGDFGFSDAGRRSQPSRHRHWYYEERGLSPEISMELSGIEPLTS